MSLATRCPVCQTVFRVVQDQLKVSEGWVRCGRCAKVFNAFEGLFDLEREFPALRSSSTTGSASPSQKVLEDLARRNPRPQHGAQWEQELDTRATFRAASSQTVPPIARAPTDQPAAPPAKGPAAAPPPGPPIPGAAPFRASVPAPFQPSAPPPFQASAPAPFKPSQPAPFKPSQPAPFKPSQPAPFKPSQPAPFRPSAPASFKPSAPAPLRPSAPAPFQPSRPAPQQDTSATQASVRRRDTTPLPPQPPVAPAVPDDVTVAPMAALASRPSAVPIPGSTARSASAGQANAPPATPKPAPAAPEVEIRDEPAPVPGTAAESVEAEDNSFEALFRSDGEMAEPATATDDVDIMLDGNEIEPASLDPDDAVDSRLLTFVQQAEKAERWRRPWVRVVMVLSAVVLTGLLAAQIVVARRDSVVAQWPESRSLMQALCAPFDCRIEPLRRIEQISVDSSGLTRIDDGPVYRLALVLRNRGDTPLLTPAIDLSLTDASGTLVTRRMLSASDLGASRTTIAPQQELPLQALLMSADRPLTGYTIEIFYP